MNLNKVAALCLFLFSTSPTVFAEEKSPKQKAKDVVSSAKQVGKDAKDVVNSSLNQGSEKKEEGKKESSGQSMKAKAKEKMNNLFK